MPKRTDPRDASQIVDADDLEDVVQDKRAGWRANPAKSRRRQRRYKSLLTRALVRGALSDDDDERTVQ